MDFGPYLITFALIAPPIILLFVDAADRRKAGGGK